jgi:hypothetical protein
VGILKHEVFRSQSAREREVDTFALVGVVDHQPAFADFDGHVLRCTRLLWDRARLLVAMGETFVGLDDQRPVEASLETSGIAMLLTFARACDRVVVARVHLDLGSVDLTSNHGGAQI